MSSDIAARLIIQLIDNLSGPAGKAEKSLKGITSAANSINANKATGELDKLAAALKKAEAESKKLGEFRNSLGGLQKARAEFRGAQADVTELARRLNEARAAEQKAAEFMGRMRYGPFGKDFQKGASDSYKQAKQQLAELEKQYKSAQREVRSAAKDFNEQKDAVSGARKALSEMGIGLNEVASAEKRVRESIAATTKALKEQASAAESAPAGGAGGGGAAPRRGWLRRLGGGFHGMGMIAGPGILAATYKGIKSSAEIQHEIELSRTAGVPPEQLAEFIRQSGSLQAKYLNVPRSAVIATGKELRSVLAHPGDATDLLETTIRAKSALDATDPSGDSSKSLAFAVKAAEILGKGKNKEDFTKFMDAFVRAKQVMGNLVTPEGLFDYAKYTKASGSFLTDRFNSTTGASLSMEVGGSTAGKYIDQFVKQITGGFQGNLHSAAKEFVSLGLADKSDFETTKTGEIKGMKPGHNVKGAALAASDPDLWIYNVLVPALTKAGITDPEQMNMKIRRLFPNTNAADLVSKLISQQASFANHAGLYPQAEGMGAADKQNGDPFRALNNLTTSLSNFAATVGSPSMEKAAGFMNWMAQKSADLSEGYSKWAKDNPGMANAAGFGAMGAGVAGGGYLTYGLFQMASAGPALTGAAAELSAAATALQVAAGEEGAAGALPGGKKGGGIWGLLGWLGLAGAAATSTHAAWNDASGRDTTRLKALRARYGDGIIDQVESHNWLTKIVPMPDYDEFQAKELITKRQTARENGWNPARPGTNSGPHSRIGSAGNSPGLASNHRLDELLAKAASATKAVNDVSAATASPKVDTSQLEKLLKLIDQVKQGMASLGSAASAASNRVHADHGLGGM